MLHLLPATNAYVAENKHYHKSNPGLLREGPGCKWRDLDQSLNEGI